LERFSLAPTNLLMNLKVKVYPPNPKKVFPNVFSKNFYPQIQVCWIPKISRVRKMPIAMPTPPRMRPVSPNLFSFSLKYEITPNHIAKNHTRVG